MKHQILKPVSLLISRVNYPLIVHIDFVVFSECDFVLAARKSSHTFYYQFDTSMRFTKIRRGACLEMTNAKMGIMPSKQS